MDTFYFAPGTCSLAVHIALEEAGASFSAVRVDLAQGQQRGADYLALNPKGRVPLLLTAQGPLTETPALLMYVAQCHPQAGLAPLDDAFALARVQAFNSYLCSTVHVAHAHGRRGSRWVDPDDAAAIEAMRRRVPHSYGECFELIEREMLQGPWVMGEHYSIADAYLFTLAGWLESDGVDPARFPKVLAHRERMGQRPAVLRALARVQQG